MDWDTAMQQKLKRFNAAAERAIAKREAGEATSELSAPTPKTWDEALKHLLSKTRRKAARMFKADALSGQEGASAAK